MGFLRLLTSGPTAILVLTRNQRRNELLEEGPVASRNLFNYNKLVWGEGFLGKAHAKASFSTGFFAPLWRTDLTDSGVFLILRCLSGRFLPCVVGRNIFGPGTKYDGLGQKSGRNGAPPPHS